MSKKLSDQEFIDKAKVRYPNYGYEKVRYVNNYTKILLICDKHGEFEITPNSLFRPNRYGCPKCARIHQGDKIRNTLNNRLKTRKLNSLNKKIRPTKQFLSSKRKNDFFINVKIIHPNYDWSKVVYINNYTKVDVICPIHGTFHITPNGLLTGRGCKKCSIESHTLTTQEFIDRSKSIHGSTYGYEKVNYINSKTKVEILCKIHGSFYAFPFNHLKGQGCKKCNLKLRKTRKLHIDEFIFRANKIHNNKYNYSKVNYINSDTKVEILCKIHGSFYMTPAYHLAGGICTHCSNSTKKTHIEIKSLEDFISKSILIHGDMYNYNKVNYVKPSSKVEIICNKHGSFHITPYNHLMGRGCPKCRESKGEKFISKWLDTNGIKYVSQKRFDTCRDKSELPFDFHINNTKILIEYDGIQHYKIVEAWGGEEGLKQRMLHDHIKSTWARVNNYIVIRLDYLMSDQERLDMLETIKRYNCLKAMKAS